MPQEERYEYEFVCAGRLSDVTVETLDATRPVTQESRTTVRVSVRDAAELHGSIARFEALGIELIEMRRLPASTDAATDAGDEED